MCDTRDRTTHHRFTSRNGRDSPRPYCRRNQSALAELLMSSSAKVFGLAMKILGIMRRRGDDRMWIHRCGAGSHDL